MDREKVVLAILCFALLITACGGNKPKQEDQVKLGKDVYTQQCASCHDGGSGPPISKSTLTKRSNGNALGVFTYVSRTMPFGSAGLLDDQEYWDVVAFLLSENGQLPKDIVLSSDNAKGLSLKIAEK